MTLRLRTNSKINLYLRVVGRRPDGFHSIETVFHSVSLADRLSAESSGAIFEVNMTSAHGGTDLPDQRSNIVWRAAEALAEATRSSPRGRIDIDKRIPLGAGLAGGSGNAAGALMALQSLWGSDADLASLAPSLGADVPFCLQGGTAAATGKGETLKRIEPPNQMWFVLGISAEPLFTARVYEDWSPADQEPGTMSDMVDALAFGPEAVARSLRNDLELPAFRLRPELPDKKQAMLGAGALGALVSGSGPTIFALASDRVHALEIAAGCRDNFDRVEVVHSTSTCVEEDGVHSGSADS